MTEQSNSSIKGDRALSAGDEDKLGFRDVAARIALSLVDHASDNGLVIGVEGAWGSGKSSLVYLIEDELRKLPDGQRPTVINFRPWLIGNRDALIRSLFSELSNKLDEIALKAGDATSISVTKAKEAAQALRKFAQRIGKAGAVVEFAGDISGLKPLQWLGRGFAGFGKSAEGDSVEPQLSDLKAKLIKALELLGHRFIITIDDVDRLEPKEVLEVLRLTRSVADFPNVVYLMCYDSGIISHSIKEAAKVESGRAYLEKIVQLTVMVPQPEPFQLRQWFSDDLHKIASVKNADELERLKSVVDFEGGRQLKTPRSVVRALDSIRFFWPALRKAEADLADLVWLQLIKDGNPKLYRWIESYCATAAALSLGTCSVQETERASTLAELHNCVEPNHFDDHIYRHYFAEQLPGVDVDFANDGPGLKVYQSVSDGKRDAAIRAGRLASPDHYRLYFALAGPLHALKTEDFDAMWAALEAGAEEGTAELMRLHQERISDSLGKADILLERIKGGAFEVLSAKQCENLLVAFSQTLDRAYRIRPFDRFWVTGLWDRAERLVPALLLRLEPDARDAVLRKMFEHGEAMGWLTSLLRHETFAHGRYGSRLRPEEDWLLTDEQLDAISEIMLDRYQALSPEQVFAGIDPTSLLFAWLQIGDKDGPRRLIEANIATDGGLIDTLEGLTSDITTSDRGSFDVLTRDNLSPFLDYDATAERVIGLKDDGNLGERARRLAVAFESGLSH